MRKIMLSLALMIYFSINKDLFCIRQRSSHSAPVCYNIWRALIFLVSILTIKVTCDFWSCTAIYNFFFIKKNFRSSLKTPYAKCRGHRFDPQSGRSRMPKKKKISNRNTDNSISFCIVIEDFFFPPLENCVQKKSGNRMRWERRVGKAG